MKINLYELEQQLRQGLKPIYLITGDEPLLVDEACQQIRDYAAQQGFTEREKYQADRQLDWQSLWQSANSLSLFSSQKLIEIQLQNKLTETASKGLLSYLASPNTDTLILLHGSKLDASASRTKWFKTIETQGIYLPIWPLVGAKLTQWLQHKLKQAQIQLDHEALLFFSEQIEGNLLAAQQEIEKIKLLQIEQCIDVKTMREIIDNASRFTLFNLIETVLRGEREKAIIMLKRMRAEGLESHLLIWHIAKALRSLYQLQFGIAQGQNFGMLCKQERIFGPNQQAYQMALRRLSSKKIATLLKHCRHIDFAIKGLSDDDPLLLTERLIMNLT